MQLGQLEDQTFSSGGPLLEAVNTGRIDMVAWLLAHGADPNASVSPRARPPLQPIPAAPRVRTRPTRP
jgi:hypothetical protein